MLGVVACNNSLMVSMVSMVSMGGILMRLYFGTVLSGGSENELFLVCNPLIFQGSDFGWKLKSAPPTKPRRTVPVKALCGLCLRTTGQ